MSVGLGRWLLGARGYAGRWVDPRLRFAVFGPLERAFVCLEAVGLLLRFAAAVAVASLGLTIGSVDRRKVLAVSFVVVADLLRDSWFVVSGSGHFLLQHR
jgi:hypothetical protein